MTSRQPSLTIHEPYRLSDLNNRRTVRSQPSVSMQTVKLIIPFRMPVE